jgi:hypothetical protein
VFGNMAIFGKQFITDKTELVSEFCAVSFDKDRLIKTVCSIIRCSKR